MTVNRKEWKFSYISAALASAALQLWWSSHSVVSDSFATPWTAAHQAPLSMGFSRQEQWSGLPCPPPGDRPNPGIEPTSPALQVDSLPLSNFISLFTVMHWRRKWQPTPVSLPGESQGWESLVGCHLWGHRVGHD